ncbi:DUF418 domain-containing protein [Ferrimonas aestuarii]|uniref:DUF418 domain-containing protein n=1 Tax=Ferrimonas aestuarii TaxID=2569539 RepID=A0A4U1BKH4_9GAMM|nr:DUF418 domain-containing protein [Ferrimonas aestuarii]TKB52823.1 DUF418 domain-containing protein [Ferrimonas aestuarii]
MNQRVLGFDVARALAIFGMVIVNFKIAMSADSGNSLLLGFSTLFEGRSSALFVMLAGVGISMLAKRARIEGSANLINLARRRVAKRGLLLFLVGLLYTPIWEADILHFYGIYFLFAVPLLFSPQRTLLAVAVGVVLAFPLLMLIVDYGANWDWDSFQYRHFWTLDGMVRHLFFNGFHPVFPWAAFLVFGMWLGRLDLSQASIRVRLFSVALTVLLLTETLFYVIRMEVGNGHSVGLTAEEVEFLLSVSIIPPLPQYMVSATCSSVMVLVASLYFADKYQNRAPIQWLSQTGRLALTLYVAHVVLGMGLLEQLGWLEGQDIASSLVSALLFCLGGTIFSALWLGAFKEGPLEWLFRKLAR